MANVSSVNGNKIVLDDGTLTEAMVASGFAKALIKGRGYDDDAGTALTDANAAERNSVVMVWVKEHVQNLPSDLSSEDGCFLVTIGNGKNTGVTSTCMQLCVSVKKTVNDAANYKACIWCRSRYGISSQDWSAWVKLTSSIDGVTIDDLSAALTKKLLVSQGMVNDSSEPLDANTVTRGTVYFITSTASVSNLPAGAGANPMGYLVSLATGTGNVGATSATFQIFAECLPHAEAYGPWFGGLWYRSRYGASTNTWSEWGQVATIDEVMEQINQPALSDVSMFRKVGVLGDSFASGTMYVDGTFIKQDYEQAWPKNMARQHGIEVERYSASGWGCYDWINITGSYGLDKFLADVDGGNVCGLYIICYGINDSNPNHSMGGVSGGMDYIGNESDVDESDYTRNANTYWGQLSRIICTIQEKCPNSKIIVSTLARENNTTRKAYTEAVKEIADYWGVPYIHLYGDAYFTSSWWNNGMDGSHPTAPMYAGMAVAMNRLISRCIGSHYSYFKTYAGIEGA